VSRTSQLAVLAVSCALALPASGHAASVSVSAPVTANYWQTLPFSVSGVADQDAELLAVRTPPEGACLASEADLVSANQYIDGIRFMVKAGPFQQDLRFDDPKTRAKSFLPGVPQWAVTNPGPYKICVYLRELQDPRVSHQTPMTYYATGGTSMAIGPDCLGFRPIAPPKLTGRAGTLKATGDIAWPITAFIPYDESGAALVGPGAWSLPVPIPNLWKDILKKDAQLVHVPLSVEMSQPCAAPDGSSAPSPFNVLTHSEPMHFRIARGGRLLRRGDPLPPPTFGGVAATKFIITPDVKFPANSTGTFTRELSVEVPGKKSPQAIGSGNWDHHPGFDNPFPFEVEIKYAGRALLARIGKKVKSATLHIETSYSGESGSFENRTSTMKIVRG
jgi:hypothetical protein